MLIASYMNENINLIIMKNTNLINMTIIYRCQSQSDTLEKHYNQMFTSKFIMK